jgi:hypothetical protein
MRTTNATGDVAGDASPVGMVCVARDQDDPRAILVPIDELANVHVARDCGGRRQVLARPNLGGYIPPALIPPGAPFGYGGDHQREHVMPIKVLVQEARTDPAVLEELRRRAKHAKLRPGYYLPGQERPRQYQRAMAAMTPDLLATARQWLTSRDGANLDEKRVEQMADRSVCRAVRRHFEGGLHAFVRAAGVTAVTEASS